MMKSYNKGDLSSSALDPAVRHVGFLIPLKECGDMATAKAKGLVRQEGKEYVMKDGDVTLFRFNV